MTLVAYVRASTERQVASPETQEHHIRQWCSEHDHELVRVYREEVISRKTEIERRTALPQLVAEIRDHKHRDFDGVIVWRTDRLFGNQAEFHRLLAILDKHRCEIISIMDPVRRDTAAERFMTAVMADAAAYERELIAERVFAHHVTAFLQGKWPGGPTPLGLAWDREQARFVAGDRAEDVPTVFRAYIEANGSSKQAVKRLNAISLPSPRGGLWSGAALLCVLRNPVYRLKMVYAGHEIDAAQLVPRLVDEGLVSQVDMLLKVSKERGFRPRTIGSKRAYSGLLRCSVCGATMTSGGRETQKHSYKNWQCANRRGYHVCESRQIANSYIDALMARAMERLARRYRRGLAGRIRARLAAAPDTKSRRTARERLTAERQRVVDLYVKGYIDDADFRTRASAIDAKLKDLAEAPARSAPVGSDVVAALDSLAGDWEYIPEAEKRGLLLQLDAEIVVNTSGEPPLWLSLKTVLNSRPIVIAAARRGRWGLRILPDARPSAASISAYRQT